MSIETSVSPTRVRGDFNGLFEDVLCLSHGDSCLNESGEVVLLKAGMTVTAIEEDYDAEGKRDDLVATGVVEHSPSWLKCRGSKWALMINANGVQHQSYFKEKG